jgi:hypothetical protein
MDEIETHLAKRFPNNQVVQQYFGPILRMFAASGCADKNFCKEIGSADDGQFWSRVWEAILYKRFHDLDWKISGVGVGPDFRLMATNCKALVEATVPAPDGLPEEWLSMHDGVYSMPHEEMVLRWTSSLSTKSKKHLVDIEKGVVSASEPFVIAINSCRLSSFGRPDEFGISQWPFAVEAVFPIGPLAIPVHRETGEFGEKYQSLRFSINKREGVDISTGNFLDPEYAHVSALLGCASCFVDERVAVRYCRLPPMFIVHNPLATNPLPRGWLPGALEYFAEEKEPGEYLLSRPKELN